MELLSLIKIEAENSGDICIYIFETTERSQKTKRKILLESLNIKPAQRCPKNKEIECTICLSKVTSKELIRTLICNHIFHKKCIDKWLIQCNEDNIHCPICRTLI